MKVAINAVSAKMGGAVTYLRNVLHCLPPAESGHVFMVFLPPETAEGLGTLASNIRLIPTRIGHANFWKRVWWEQVTLRHQIRKLDANVLFSTANFGMFYCPARQVLLLRIALYFSRIYLGTFLPRHSLKFRSSFALRRWLCRQSARWADVVMTPTQAMMDEVCAYVAVPAPKRLVNHYGVAQPRAADKVHIGRHEKHGMVRLLYISLYAEHKNLQILLKALPLLNRGAGPGFVLTTTVSPEWHQAQWTVTYKQDLALARDPEIRRWVNFVGPLGSQGISELYEHSDVFIFPALTESFGHPMAEAMAYGVPIVAADTPVNREICGEAAVYFSPLVSCALAEAIHSVALDDALRERLTREGQRRVRENFCWDEHVRRFLHAVQGDVRTVGEVARDVAVARS